MTVAPRRVLIVEDDSSQQLMYQRALRTMDFETVAASSAPEALRALAKDKFAIVILDLNLSGELSLDLFEEIRERYPAISVVIATGHGTFEFARRSIHRDVVDFLAKPIPLSDLERALDRAWSRHVLVQTPVSKLLLPRISNEAVEEAAPDEAAPAWLTTRKSLNIDVIERELIMEALRRSGDNRKMAADMLGMSERKLYYRLTQYRVS
jgi:DNA-binding NtrC family response regulator